MQSKNVNEENNEENQSNQEPNQNNEANMDNNITVQEHRFTDQSSLNGAANNRHIYPNERENSDLLTFFSNVKAEVINHIQQRCIDVNGVKWYLCVQVELEKEKDGEIEKAWPHFRSKNYVFMLNEMFNENDLYAAFQKMFASFEEYLREGSSWVLKRIIKLEVSTVNYAPLGGSSYIPTPTTFTRRRPSLLVNVQNSDDKCFLWACLAALHPIIHYPEHVSNYLQYEHELDVSGITYPVKISNVNQFEKQNNISINVFGCEDKSIFPMYITKIREATHHINLLFLQHGKKTHYCLIKDLNKFLYRTKLHRNKTHFCHYCLQGFTRADLLDTHIEYCSKFDPQHVELPKENDSILQFSQYQKQLKCPFIIYADFETYAQKMDTCLPNPESSSTTINTQFEPCGFGYQVVCINDKYTKPPVIYRGPNVSRTFLENIIEEENLLKQVLSYVEPVLLTADDQAHFDASTLCHICNKPFTDEDQKVLDHCHLLQSYRGAAHNSCNLNFKYNTHIPVVFHNLKSFDAHIICNSMGLFKDRDIKVLPLNMEKYISFSLGNLRFIDSFQFMSQSLESLTNNLANEGLSKFKYFSREFESSKAMLLLRKGVYPYEYVDCENKFLETSLPPRDQFYSQLSKSHISETEYAHAQNVWSVMNIQNLGQYHDLYLKTDVLLLTDIFENFRTTCLNYYGLDPAHYFTSPGLAWDSALKMTDVRLELLTDPDMYLFFEQGVRGGVSMISNKFAAANNDLIPETYDASNPNSYILYLDCNNLYGGSMSQPLPEGFFRWIDDVEKFDVMSIPKNGDLGYVLQVDLEYPEELHDFHSDYPLAPESMHVSDEMLSPHSQQLWKKLHPSSKHTNTKLHGRVTTSKLTPTLQNKTKYICHYRSLQLYLELGMKLTKIHRVLEFKQSPWLAKYINFNTSMRKNAKNEFERDFFKLMNNAVFGKTMENVRLRTDIKLTHTEQKFKKYCARPSFHRFKIFNEELSGVENKKIRLCLNKPLYVGMSVLDLSKCIMYEFYYKYLKTKYGENMKLLFTDTDSLCVYVECENMYNDMYTDRHLYDLSNFPKDHFCYDVSNKKQPGKFKDECGSSAVKEFVGLRAKMYSFTYAIQNKTKIGNATIISNTIKEKQIAKGVNRATIKRDLRHEMYKSCLFDEKNYMCEMNSIRSSNHQLYIHTINNSALSAFDDKRFVFPSGDTLAHGHYRIKHFQ